VTESGPGDCGAPPWLRRLAASAAVMEVPPVLLPPVSGGRRSAVLVLFGEGTNGADLLYIQKNEGLRRHAGQPAFPGGKIEDSDASPVAAALREAAEETGLDPAGVDVLTSLPELYVAASHFRVIPVLAWWREPSAVRPVDIGEVAAVERIAVADLADPANRVMVGYPDGRRGPAFRIGSMMIWGFTGLITDRLLDLGGWQRPWADSVVVHDIPRATLLRPPGGTERGVTQLPDGAQLSGVNGYRGHRAR
jgi:8-oxo-dGTP pyrophosphatase MutT (NUDIX family)